MSLTAEERKAIVSLKLSKSDIAFSDMQRNFELEDLGFRIQDLGFGSWALGFGQRERGNLTKAQKLHKHIILFLGLRIQDIQFSVFRLWAINCALCIVHY